MEHGISGLHGEIRKCDNEDPGLNINDIQNKYTKETDPHIHAKCSTYGIECDEQQQKDNTVKHSLNSVENGIDVSLKCSSVDGSLKSKPSAKSVVPDLVYTSSAGSSKFAFEFMGPEDTSVDELCNPVHNSNDSSPKYFAVPFPGESSKSNFLVQHRDNYWCKICRKGFESQAKLRVHVAIHAKKGENDRSQFLLRYTKTFSCTECGEVFRSNKMLTKHLAHHSEGRPPLCKKCGKTFEKPLSLLKHLTVHSEERLHLCDVCGKAFKRWSNLKVHLTFHSEERPYMCNICGKAFKLKYNLTYHLITHSKELLYVCDVCKKGFKTKSTLTKHLVIHSEERPYVCELCGKAFKLQCGMMKHRKRHSS